VAIHNRRLRLVIPSGRVHIAKRWCPWRMVAGFTPLVIDRARLLGRKRRFPDAQVVMTGPTRAMNLPSASLPAAPFSLLLEPMDPETGRPRGCTSPCASDAVLYRGARSKADHAARVARLGTKQGLPPPRSRGINGPSGLDIRRRRFRPRPGAILSQMNPKPEKTVRFGDRRDRAGGDGRQSGPLYRRLAVWPGLRKGLRLEPFASGRAQGRGSSRSSLPLTFAPIVDENTAAHRFRAGDRACRSSRI